MSEPGYGVKYYLCVLALSLAYKSQELRGLRNSLLAISGGLFGDARWSVRRVNAGATRGTVYTSR